MVKPVVVLDAGPLGLVTNPKLSATSSACNTWLEGLTSAGRRIIIPEIADYEVRRELLRLKKGKSIAALDHLASLLEYRPITTAVMRQAAEYWADARRKGKPTAAESSLDADVILAAQAMSLGVSEVVVATTNVAHLSRFVPAELWQKIAV